MFLTSRKHWYEGIWNILDLFLTWYLIKHIPEEARPIHKSIKKYRYIKKGIQKYQKNIPIMRIETKIGKAVERSGLRKNFIAKKMNVQPNTLTRWCNGGRIYLDDAVHLSKILGCKLTDLYEEK
ncbi:Cro/C1-type HTH DNA-binding domain-containing protein [Halobacillus karajensis]|uniref:helix-turn-helix domain-containing protein n=1 Tax=Halobacillus karajensis TaxID=195088 RepID=UPI0008A72E8F|nr:Cro/C1-type HTH DNA-binding domain-containing protein [Halobacillus karajensis]